MEAINPMLQSDTFLSEKYWFKYIWLYRIKEIKMNAKFNIISCLNDHDIHYNYLYIFINYLNIFPIILIFTSIILIFTLINLIYSQLS